MSSHQEELNKALELVGYRSHKHEVLVVANAAMPLESYLAIVAGEVKELAEEYETWKEANRLSSEQLQLPKSFFMELFDVLVTLRNARERVAPGFSVETTIFSVNGQFKGNFNSLNEQVLNLGTGNIERNLQLIFTELLSMMKHLDVNLQTEVYVGLMSAKLEANKESRFYQKEPGMTEADILLKYDHVTAALRVLRNFLRKTTGQEMTLQSWITDFFVEEILDWRNSEVAMLRLQQKIILFQQQIKDEMVWETTANIRDPNFEIKMLLAGAKLINNPNPEAKDKALQSRSANATLGQTIFWV